MVFGKRTEGTPSSNDAQASDIDFIRITNFLQGPANAQMKDLLKRYAQTQIDTVGSDASVISDIVEHIGSILRTNGTKISSADLTKALAAAHARGRIVSNIW